MIEFLKKTLMRHRIIDESGCWRWTRAKDGAGYGHMVICGEHLLVHRVAAALWLGLDIESELCALHRCDNPDCFNPEHLRIGTKADNTADMILKKRDRFTGERNPRSRLTDEDVREIRRLASEGTLQRELAARHGLNPSAISQIVNRRSWAHVE